MSPFIWVPMWDRVTSRDSNVSSCRVCDVRPECARRVRAPSRGPLCPFGLKDFRSALGRSAARRPLRRGLTRSKRTSVNMAAEESLERPLNPRHAIHPAQAAGACAIFIRKTQRSKPTMESSIISDNGHGARDDTSSWLESIIQALHD